MLHNAVFILSRPLANIHLIRQAQERHANGNHANYDGSAQKGNFKGDYSQERTTMVRPRTLKKDTRQSLIIRG